MIHNTLSETPMGTHYLWRYGQNLIETNDRPCFFSGIYFKQMILSQSDPLNRFDMTPIIGERVSSPDRMWYDIDTPYRYAFCHYCNRKELSHPFLLTNTSDWVWKDGCFGYSSTNPCRYAGSVCYQCEFELRVHYCQQSKIYLNPLMVILEMENKVDVLRRNRIKEQIQFSCALGDTCSYCGKENEDLLDSSCFYGKLIQYKIWSIHDQICKECFMLFELFKCTLSQRFNFLIFSFSTRYSDFELRVLFPRPCQDNQVVVYSLPIVESLFYYFHINYVDAMEYTNQDKAGERFDAIFEGIQTRLDRDIEVTAQFYVFLACMKFGNINHQRIYSTPWNLKLIFEFMDFSFADFFVQPFGENHPKRVHILKCILDYKRKCLNRFGPEVLLENRKKQAEAKRVQPVSLSRNEQYLYAQDQVDYGYEERKMCRNGFFDK